MTRTVVVGASGVLGRAAIPHFREHALTGNTRTPANASLLERVGVRALACDVYDHAAPLAPCVERGRYLW